MQSLIFLRAHELLLTVIILQKIGKASPSVVASLIERLPDEGDPQRFMEEGLRKMWLL
jgi:hypothetical protein